MSEPSLSEESKGTAWGTRRRWLWVGAILIALGLAVWGVRKGSGAALYRFTQWRVERQLKLVKSMEAEGRMEQAIQGVQAALQLRPASHVAKRELTRLYLKDRHPSAREASASLILDERTSPQEVQELLALFLRSNDYSMFSRLVDALRPAVAERPGIRYLRAQCLERMGRSDEAVAMARSCMREHPADGRFEYLLARLLLRSGDSIQRAEALALLTGLMDSGLESSGRKAFGLIARIEPAQRDRRLVDAGLRRFARIEQATPEEQLLALELRIARTPSEKAALVAEAVEASCGQCSDGLLAWLVRNGEHERVVKMLDAESARQSGVRYESYAVALSECGRFAEAQKFTQERIPQIDPWRWWMLRAGTAASSGDEDFEMRSWGEALRCAALDVMEDRFYPLALAARAVGCEEVAVRAMAESIVRGYQHVPESELEVVIEWLRENGQAEFLRQVFEKLAYHRPRDVRHAVELCHWRVVCGHEVEATIGRLKALLPVGGAGSELRASLALGHLRQERVEQALEVLAGEEIDAGKRPRTAAVYATALAANGLISESDAVRETIDYKELSAAERGLLMEIEQVDRSTPEGVYAKARAEILGRGDVAAAAESLRRIVQSHPLNERYRSLLVLAHLMTGQPAHAYLFVDSGLSEESGRGENPLLGVVRQLVQRLNGIGELGELQSTEGLAPEELAIVAELATLRPPDAELRARRAYLDLIHDRNLGAVVQEYTQLCSMEPERSDWQLVHAVSRLRNGEVGEACAMVRRLLERSELEDSRSRAIAAYVLGYGQEDAIFRGLVAGGIDREALTERERQVFAPNVIAFAAELGAE